MDSIKIILEIQKISHRSMRYFLVREFAEREEGLNEKMILEQMMD
jgi:hypothetical protein